MFKEFKELFSNEKGTDIKPFLYYETAFRTHNFDGVERATSQKSNLLADVLQLLSIPVERYDHMLVHKKRLGCPEAQTELLTDGNQIKSYDLWETINKEPAEINLVLSYNEGHIILLNLKKILSFKAISYMRVSVMKPDFSETDDLRTIKSKNHPVTLSLLLSYAVNGYEKLLNLYEEAEIHFKSSDPDEKTEEDYAILYGAHEHCDKSTNDAIELFEKERYYDAFLILKHRYDYLRRVMLSDDDEELVKEYEEVCQYLSDCQKYLYYWDEAYSYAMDSNSFQTQWLCGALCDDPEVLRDIDYAIKLPELEKEREKTYEEIGLERIQFSDETMQRIKETREVVQRRLFQNYSDNSEFLRSEQTVSSTFRLKDFLDYFHIHKENILDNITLVYCDGSTRTYTTEDLYDLPLSYPVKEPITLLLSITHANTKEAIDKATANNDIIDKSELCDEATFILFLRRIPSSHISYLRCDGMQTCFPKFDYEWRTIETIAPESLSIILGTSSLDFEPNDFDTSFTFAGTLMEQMRVSEALKVFRICLYYIQWLILEEDGTYNRNFLTDDGSINYDADNIQLYYRILFKIGTCLVELMKFPDAKMFLSRASDIDNYEYKMEYVNCLSNSKDPDTFETINEYLEDSEEKPENEESLEEWNNFRAFLKRRMSFTLVDQEKWDEAKKLLTEMLDDPLCKDFALGELKYIHEKTHK